jgi:hypothetical protein
VNSKEENSEDFCLDFVQEFGLGEDSDSQAESSSVQYCMLVHRTLTVGPKVSYYTVFWGANIFHNL